MIRETIQVTKQPVITILMTVFNGAAFLLEAVESILQQTFQNFNFLIIDDGSTDGSGNILRTVHDPRMRVERNMKNLGLISSLNMGIELAQGKYIARMDADDIALPERLEKQVAFMERHPEIGILGTACYTINKYGQKVGLLRPPEDNLKIRWASLLSCPFAHPTVMIRYDVLVRNNLKYDEAFQAAADYELWVRLLNYTHGSNLCEPLLHYRIHDNRISSKDRVSQLKSQDIVVLRNIQERLPEVGITLKQASQLRALFSGGADLMPSVYGQRISLAELYLDMFRAFMNRYRGDPGFKILQRQEAIKVAINILHSPLSPGCLHVLRRLITMYPGLPLSLLHHLLCSAYYRLKRFLTGNDKTLGVC